MNTQLPQAPFELQPLSSQQHCCLTPSQREMLQEHLQAEQKSEYRQRIAIILLTDAGYSQSQICAELGCSQETARYWMTMARTGQSHCWQEHPIGRPKIVSDSYLERLQELVHLRPNDCGYSFKSWTAQRLSQHLAQEFGINISDRHINRLLKKMGLSTNKHSSSGQHHPPESHASIVIENLPPSSMPLTTPLWVFRPSS